MKSTKSLNKYSLNHIFSYCLLVLAIVIGGVSLLLFVPFLYSGALGVVEVGLTESKIVLVDVTLSLFFFVQHSYMIRQSFHQKLACLFPSHLHRVLYGVFSGCTLLLVIVLWQESHGVVTVVEGAGRLFLRLLFFLSVVGCIWGADSLTAFDIFGKNEIFAHLNRRTLPVTRFTISGPYGYVRHPFYFFILVMIWSCPEITHDRLLFNCLWSSWIVVGTILEEQDLVKEFGEDYRKYQKRVPMLIPWKIKACKDL